MKYFGPSIFFTCCLQDIQSTAKENIWTGGSLHYQGSYILFCIETKHMLFLIFVILYNYVPLQPLFGYDLNLKSNLESFFQLNYPKVSVYF